MSERAPQSFFVKGAAALVLLFLVTLFIAPGPQVSALRALIVFGLVVVIGKMLLRRYGVDWPKRH